MSSPCERQASLALPSMLLMFSLAVFTVVSARAPSHVTLAHPTLATQLTVKTAQALYTHGHTLSAI